MQIKGGRKRRTEEGGENESSHKVFHYRLGMNLSDRAHAYNAHGPGFNSQHLNQTSLISNGEERDFLRRQIIQEHLETFAVVLSFPSLVQSGTKKDKIQRRRYGLRTRKKFCQCFSFYHTLRMQCQDWRCRSVRAHAQPAEGCKFMLSTRINK